MSNVANGSSTASVGSGDSNADSDSRSDVMRWLNPSAELAQLDGDQKKLIATPYDSPWSTDWFMGVVFLLGVGVFFFVFISLITS